MTCSDGSPIWYCCEFSIGTIVGCILCWGKFGAGVCRFISDCFCIDDCETAEICEDILDICNDICTDDD